MSIYVRTRQYVCANEVISIYVMSIYVTSIYVMSIYVRTCVSSVYLDMYVRVRVYVCMRVRARVIQVI